MQQQCGLLQVGHAQRLGSLPVGLVPLPASVHQLAASGCRPPPIALVLAEQPCVVRRQPGAGFNASGPQHSSDPSSSCRPDDIGGVGAGGAFSAQGLPTAEAVCAPRLARAVALTLPAEEPRCTYWLVGTCLRTGGDSPVLSRVCLKACWSTTTRSAQVRACWAFWQPACPLVA